MTPCVADVSLLSERYVRKVKMKRAQQFFRFFFVTEIAQLRQSFLTTDLEQLLRDCLNQYLEESYFGASCSAKW